MIENGRGRVEHFIISDWLLLIESVHFVIINIQAKTITCFITLSTTAAPMPSSQGNTNMLVQVSNMCYVSATCF